MSSRFYLDADTTPPIKSRNAYKGLDATVEFALSLVGRCTEGQIGIYDKYCGSNFYGYAIKYPGEEPYFEKAEAQAQS